MCIHRVIINHFIKKQNKLINVKKKILNTKENYLP